MSPALETRPLIRQHIGLERKAATAIRRQHVSHALGVGIDARRRFKDIVMADNDSVFTCGWRSGEQWHDIVLHLLHLCFGVVLEGQEVELGGLLMLAKRQIRRLPDPQLEIARLP